MLKMSAKELETFQFPSKIKQCLTSKKVRINIDNPEIRFIDGLMAYMKEHYAEWTNSSVKEWVCITRIDLTLCAISGHTGYHKGGLD